MTTIPPMVPPSVSVVMPTFQRAGRIRVAIESVIAQSMTNWELLIVDSGSSDGTDEIIDRFDDPRIRRFDVPVGSTIAASRNHAIANSRGEWIAFLDSDDSWLPFKLERQVATTTSADWRYHRLQLETPRAVEPIWYGHPANTGMQAREFLIGGNLIPNSSVMVKRSALESVGCLDEARGLMGVEDFDLWVRLWSAGYRPGFDPDVLGKYWMDGRNITSRLALRSEHPLTRLYSKHLGSLGREDAILATRRLRRTLSFGALGKVDDCGLLGLDVRTTLHTGMHAWPAVRNRDRVRWFIRLARAIRLSLTVQRNRSDPDA